MSALNPESHQNKCNFRQIVFWFDLVVRFRREANRFTGIFAIYPKQYCPLYLSKVQQSLLKLTVKALSGFRVLSVFEVNGLIVSASSHHNKLFKIIPADVKCLHNGLTIIIREMIKNCLSVLGTKPHTRLREQKMHSPAKWRAITTYNRKCTLEHCTLCDNSTQKWN